MDIYSEILGHLFMANITRKSFIRSVGALSTVTCALTSGICSSYAAKKIIVSTKGLTQEDLLSGISILGYNIQDTDLPEDDVFALSEEMEDFLKLYVTERAIEPYWARQLNRALFNEEMLAMKYDVTKTFTAQGAFEQKSGNCLAYCLLYSAFASKAGIEFEIQEVYKPLDWSPISGETDQAWRHINLLIKSGTDAGSVFDIDDINRNQKHVVSRTLSRDHVVGLYYSNIGAGHLLKDDIKNAFLYLAKGLKLAPNEPDLWVNLGVLYKKSGHHDHAKLAYETALDLNNNSYTALTNLSSLYETLNQSRLSKLYEEKAKESQITNPNYRFRLAQIDYNKKQYRRALRHLDFAINVDSNDQRFLKLKEKIERVKDDQQDDNLVFRKLNFRDMSGGKLVLY